MPRLTPEERKERAKIRREKKEKEEILELQKDRIFVHLLEFYINNNGAFDESFDKEEAIRLIADLKQKLHM